MRPLLLPVLDPPEPTDDMKPSTLGSWAMTAAACC